MATDTDTSLILSISADVRQLSRALKRMESETGRSTRAVEKQFDDMGKNVDRSVSKLGSSITGIVKNFGAGLAGGLAGAFSAQQFARFADGATRITNALKVAGLEGKNLSDTYERLGKIALANGASFESVANLYAKVSQNAKTLGITSREAEEFTRRIAVGLRASGTDASAASAGIMQLNQALASGVLRGDEFNSVAENLPVVAKAIADGMGVTVGELRQLAADGELTAKTVFDAFIKGSEGLDAQAGKTSATFSQAFENITTALTIAVGEFNKSTGASQGFADAVTNVVAPAIVGLGEVFASNNDKIREFSDWLGRISGLRSVGDEIKAVIADLGPAADPLVRALKTAQDQIKNLRTSLAADLGAISSDYDALIRTFEETGRGTAAKSLAEEFDKVAQKVRDGTFTVQDFDAAIIKLRGTGDAMASNLADALQIIQTRFAEAGAEADKSFKEAGQALADAFGSEALSTIDRLASKIGNSLPEAVNKFTAAIREAVRLMNDELKLPDQAPAPSMLGPDDFYQGGNSRFTNAKDFLKSKAVSDRIASRVEALDDNLSEALAKLLAQFPDVKIVSAARTFDEQKAIYDSGVRPAAKPGNSLHERGAAVDLSGVPEAMRAAFVEAARQAGLEFPVSGDPNHAQLIGARSSGSGYGSPKAETKTPEQLFQGDIDQIQRRIDLLNAEYEAQSKVNPLIKDYGFAADKARIQQQLLNDAKEAGVAITPELSAKIDQLATNYAKASSGAEKLAETQKEAAQASQEWGQLANTAINGITSALQDGKITAQEWLAIGVQIIQQLLQMKSIGGGGGGGLFGGLLGGGGGGGLLGGMIIPGILHDGGTVGKDGYGHGRAVPASTFSGARRFHKGLMPDEFPAILQRGEVVVPKGGVRGGGQQNTHVTVGVSVDNDGSLQAYVKDVSQKEARQATRSGLASYDKGLDRSFGGRMANAQARQL